MSEETVAVSGAKMMKLYAAMSAHAETLQVLQLCCLDVLSDIAPETKPMYDALRAMVGAKG